MLKRIFLAGMLVAGAPGFAQDEQPGVKEKIKEAGKEVGHAVKEGAKAVKEGAKKGGKAVGHGAKDVGHGVKSAVKKDKE